MGQNPEELSKIYLNTNVKVMIVWENRHYEAQIVMPEPKITKYFPLTIL